VANGAVALVCFHAGEQILFACGDRPPVGISFLMRAFSAIFAKRFSKGIGAAAVAAGAKPSEKYM